MLTPILALISFQHKKKIICNQKLIEWKVLLEPLQLYKSYYERVRLMNIVLNNGLIVIVEL